MKPISNIVFRRYLTFLVVWFGIIPSLFSQEGVPFFRNFTAQEYRAHNRNFDVVCDSTGIVYFANFEGIIFYNGADWNKILTPGISRITRLHIDKNNQIWAGGHNYIGRLETADNGAPLLKSFISDYTQENGNQTNRIGEIQEIKEDQNALFFYTQNYEIKISHDSVVDIRPYQSIDKTNHTVQTIDLSSQLQISSDGTSGIKLTETDTGHSLRITEENGLCSNMINKLAFDRNGTIWGATDDGVFAINTPSFYSHFKAEEGLKGEVTCIYRHKQSFYAGTLHGLFRYDDEHSKFIAMPMITQSCWQLKESPSGDLYAVTSNGLFKIDGTKVSKINDFNTFSLTFNPTDPQVLYTGEIDGVYLTKNNARTNIAHIEKSMKMEFSEGQLWLETLYGEIYHSTKDLKSFQLLDSIQGLKVVSGNKLYKIENEIHVLSRYGFQKWNHQAQQFGNAINPLDSNSVYTDWWPGLYASTPSRRQEWLVAGDGKRPVLFQNGEMDSLKNEMLFPIKDYIIRTIYVENNDIAWIGGDFGLIKLDFKQTDLVYQKKPTVHIRSIEVGNDSIYFNGGNMDLSSLQTLPEPRFNSSFKNFKFSFSAENNNIINTTRYAFFLEGYENGWNSWQEGWSKEYTNLSFGTYTFHVKSQDSFGRESDESTFTFTISKPFYLKWYCWFIYIIGFIVLILLFFKWRTRKLLKEKMRLETIVEERTLQIRAQRDEIAKQSKDLEIALKELEEAQDQLIQQEKMSTVAKLTQGLIDRILNPLNYIINFSHLSSTLLKDMKEDLEDEAENITEDNYEDMDEILDMLKTHLTKIEEHGNNTSRILKAMEEMLSDHTCHFEKAEINKFVTSNLAILKQYSKKELESSNIQVVFEPLSEPLSVEIDQVQLGKALMSMLLNSIYALNKKKAKIDYQPEIKIQLEKKKDQVLIHLYDNGIGIEKSIIDKIFDPFFTTKTTAEAAGVGLYLSRETILSHNGSLNIQSEKDEFTEFTFSIPIEQSLKSSNNE